MKTGTERTLTSINKYLEIEIKEAKIIIQNLKAYGIIHPITGVVYPEVTHLEFISRANEWLIKHD